MDKAKKQKPTKGSGNNAKKIDKMLEIAAERIKAFYSKSKSPVKRCLSK